MRVAVPLAKQRSSSSIVKSRTRTSVARRQADPILHLQRTLGNQATRKLLRKSSGPVTATPVVDQVLRSPGRPLDAATQRSMGARFNVDFSGVRVHDDSQAAKSALSVSAQAYTVGNHVVQQSDASVARLARKRLAGPKERILDLGSAKSLACCDANACEDDTGGFDCKDFDCPKETGDKSAINNEKKNPGHKFSPHLKCDSKCGKDFTPTYNDKALVVALPSGRREKGKDKCDQTLGMCANGKSVEVTIREYSNRNTWEAGPGVAAALGVSPDFRGSIFATANDPAMKNDPNCQPPKPKATPKKPAGK